MWLPPGGHIEANELPDEAALREVAEEAGLAVRLLGGTALPAEVAGPTQLTVPAGIQLEQIEPGHEHIDLVYYAVPVAGTTISANAESTEIGWFQLEDLADLGVTEEIETWCRKAIAEVGTTMGSQ